MNLSARVEYACLAVLELAVHYGRGEPRRVRDIAEAHGIPSPFLVQILLQLKTAGLVVSVRGASGGYQLARPPAQVSLGDVVALIEGPRGESKGSETRSGSATSRALRDAWNEVWRAEREVLESVTFADLADRVRGRSETMYYI